MKRKIDTLYNTHSSQTRNLDNNKQLIWAPSTGLATASMQHLPNKVIKTREKELSISRCHYIDNNDDDYDNDDD